jgi:hypothetical protein
MVRFKRTSYRTTVNGCKIGVSTSSQPCRQQPPVLTFCPFHENIFTLDYLTKSTYRIFENAALRIETIIYIP